MKGKTVCNGKAVRAFALAALVVSAAQAASSAVKVWKSPTGGRWSDGRNWEGGKAPASGDAVSFPVDRKSIRPRPFVNDIDGLSLESMSISGTAYQEHKGKAIEIRGRLSLDSSGGCSILNPISLTRASADGSPLLSKGAGAPATLWGRVAVTGKGDAEVCAAGSLCFAGGVETKGGGMSLSMDAKAAAAGKTVSFTGLANSFAGPLRTGSANVLLLGPVKARGGVEKGSGRLDARLLARRPGGVFFDGDKLEFLRTCVQTAPDGTEWTLSDWRGVKAVSGKWPTGDRLALPAMTKGYWRLALANGTTATFAVVPRPENRDKVTDSWYGVIGLTSVGYASCDIDAPWYGAETDRYILDLAQWAGVTWMRQWLWLGDEVRPDGSVDCSGVVRDLEEGRKRGISACLCAQTHSRLSKGGSDLAEVYRSVRLAAEKAGEGVEWWEYLNESDSNGVPAWHVAACLKAASLALKAARPGALLAPPSEHATFMKRYDDVLFASDIGKYVDFMNYHFYSTLAVLPAQLSVYRSRAAAAGLRHRPCFATEAGTYIEGTGKAAVTGRWDGLRSQDSLQEICVAEYLPKLYSLCRMWGVRRTFAFSFRPKNEQRGAKDWCWAVRRDGTVRPGYAAFSTMVEKLDGATLLGYAGATEKDVAIYAYRRRDGTITLTFWTQSEVETSLFGHGVFAGPDPMNRKFFLRVPDGEYALTDMCGAQIGKVKPASGGRLDLVATRYPQYLEGLHAVYNSFTSGRKLFLPPVDPGVPQRDPAGKDEDLSVVIRPTYNAEDFSFAKGVADRAVLAKDEGRVMFFCWNLSDKAKKGSLRVVSGKVSGVEGKTLVLPPMGSQVLVGKVKKGDIADGMLLTVDGVFGGKRTTRSAIALGATEARKEAAK